MTSSTRLSRAVARVERAPAPLRDWLRSYAIGHAIPFVGTAGLCIEQLDAQRCVIRLANRKRVQNHLKGVHAAATALLAETATGLVVGMNLPDDKLPLLKCMDIDYLKRAAGGLQASATLGAEERARMQRDERGEVAVQVAVSDAAGDAPVACTMVWAWVPKRR